MDWTLLKDYIYPVLIPVATGLLAYLGVKKGQTSSYRQALYTKQLEASTELLATVTKVILANPENRWEAWDSLLIANSKFSIFLPTDVVNSMAAAIDSLEEYVLFYDKHPAGWNEKVEADFLALTGKTEDALFEVVKSMRTHIGAESLSQEALRMFDPKAAGSHLALPRAPANNP